MRISDWSSDVCSSDLRRGRVLLLERHTQGNPIPLDRPCSLPVQSAGVNAVIVPPVPSQSRSKDTWSPILTAVSSAGGASKAIVIAGRWRDRKSVVEGKSVSVRVDLGGRRHIIKTQFLSYLASNYATCIYSHYH